MTVDRVHAGLEILGGLGVVVVFDVAGEAIARMDLSPLPGPVIGMLLLFVALVTLRERSRRLERGAVLLLRHMSLFFVPAGVGVVTQLDVIRAELGPIAAALVMSTCLGLLAAAGAFVLVLRVSPRDRA